MGYYAVDEDPNDYELQQEIAESGGPSDNSRGGESGDISSIWSAGFSGCPRSDMYRAWAQPDMYPKERQPVLSNWPQEDLEAFCGIYSKEVND